VPGRKVINLIHGGKTPLLPSSQLHDLGFKIVLYSTPALYAAASAMVKAMTLLNQTRDLSSISSRSTTFREFQQFIEGQYLRRPGGGGRSVRPGPGESSVQRRVDADEVICDQEENPEYRQAAS
jgi:hypothetical protein